MSTDRRSFVLDGGGFRHFFSLPAGLACTLFFATEQAGTTPS